MYSLLEELRTEKTILLTKKREISECIQVSGPQTQEGEAMDLLLAQMSIMEAYIQIVNLRITALECKSKIRR